ncbi:MAG: hypothetical protein ACN4GF_10000 [Lentimonas sp.]
MGNIKRTLVYFGGFLIGTMLVSIITTRRANKEEAQPDPWLEHNQELVDAGAEPLPKAVPSSMREGLIIDFGYLPSEESPEEAVWHLTFKESYPYVRVVQNVQTQELSYMAADQISIKLAEGVDVTDLKPMLDELGLRLRMFNRKEELVIVGVVSTQVDAVPATIEAVQPWADQFSSVEPDIIRFQPRKPGK